MPQASSTSRYILTTLAVLLVITAFILVGLNALNIRPLGNLGISREALAAQYRNGYQAARERYANRLPPTVEEQTSFSGLILARDGSSLTVQADNLDTDEFVDGIGSTRTVHVASNVLIRVAITKDLPTLEAEQTTFLQNPNREKLEPPSPYTYQQIRVTDLKAGQRIAVQSAVGVRLLPEIAATAVTVFP